MDYEVSKLYILSCPFCRTSCGGQDNIEGESIVKEWLGTHLGKHHIQDMQLVSEQRAKAEIINNKD